MDQLFSGLTWIQIWWSLKPERLHLGWGKVVRKDYIPAQRLLLEIPEITLVTGEEIHYLILAGDDERIWFPVPLDVYLSVEVGDVLSYEGRYAENGMTIPHRLYAWRLLE